MSDGRQISILPPRDAIETLVALADSGIQAACIMLDPWYNKGLGEQMPMVEYDGFIQNLLQAASRISPIIYLWGFPEIIGPYVRYAPDGYRVAAWLTWYYKNCPSVVRGWRPSQQACIQFTRNDARLHPENFLSEEQKERLAARKMRFIPGPPSVIESSLVMGFVKKDERTGHPAQKPMDVYEKLVLMSTEENDLIVDPMAGSGTTGAVAQKLNRRAILCDISEEYTRMMETRLNVHRTEQNYI